MGHVTLTGNDLASIQRDVLKLRQMIRVSGTRSRPDFWFMAEGPLLRVAVLAGGFSGEADVSRRSAAMVMEHIDRSAYDPVLVHIDKDRWWVENGQAVEVNRDTLVVGDDKVDLAFVMVHGTPGEDGLLQAHLDFCGIPHTTASARVMATTFHKGWTTALLRDAGMHVARSVECLPNDAWDDEDVRHRLHRPGGACLALSNPTNPAPASACPSVAKPTSSGPP